MMKVKSYTLSDGTTVTVQDVAEKVGCKLNTAYLRLKKSNKVEKVLMPLQTNQRRKDYGGKDQWVDKPVKVVMGIPINPSYMDGSSAIGGAKDRDGVKLTFGEASSLMRYRSQQREEWLHSKGVTTDDEEDKASFESHKALERYYGNR